MINKIFSVNLRLLFPSIIINLEDWSPCCPCYNLLGVVVSNYPVSTHSILTCCSYPSINLNNIAPATILGFSISFITLLLVPINILISMELRWQSNTKGGNDLITRFHTHTHTYCKVISVDRWWKNYQELYFSTWIWMRVTTQMSFRRLISRVAPKPFPDTPELVTWFRAVSYIHFSTQPYN